MKRVKLLLKKEKTYVAVVHIQPKSSPTKKFDTKYGHHNRGSYPHRSLGLVLTISHA